MEIRKILDILTEMEKTTPEKRAFYSTRGMAARAGCFLYAVHGGIMAKGTDHGFQYETETYPFNDAASNAYFRMTRDPRKFGVVVDVAAALKCGFGKQDLLKCKHISPQVTAEIENLPDKHYLDL